VATLSVLEDLQAKRRESRDHADQLLTRAADEQRDLTAEELEQYQTHVREEREVQERLEELRDEEVRELRAAATRQPDESEHPLGEWLMRGITGASGAGAAFTPSEYASTFFDRLAAQSVMLASGARVITTERDSVVLPRWLSDTTTAWVSEGGTISSTDANADTVTATPRKLASLQQVTNEVLADPYPSIFEVIAAGLVRSVALRFDLGCFEGSGTAPEIRGLSNVAGITTDTSLGANGLLPVNFDTIANALGSLLTANTGQGPAIVMHPRTWGKFLTIKEVSGSVKPVLQDSAGSVSQGVQRSIYGAPVFLSSQLSITETRGTSTDCSSIYVYQPDQVVVVQRSDVSVELDSSRLFNSDQSEVRAIARLDLIVPNPTSVVRIVGVRPV
jgi:HK97 family phage major capsid protein